MLCVRFTSFIISLWRVSAWILSCECKIDQAGITDWMAFLPYNLMEEISTNQQAPSINTLWLLSG